MKNTILPITLFLFLFGFSGALTAQESSLDAVPQVPARPATNWNDSGPSDNAGNNAQPRAPFGQDSTTQRGDSSGPGSVRNVAAAPAVSEAYVIRHGDVLGFKIYGEPDMNANAKVSADGKINLPFIKEVKVAGMTLRDARERVFALYNRDYFVEPQVELVLVHYEPKFVTVQGPRTVRNQGPVQIPPERPLYLLEAIAQCGGFTQYAKGNHQCIIKREGPDGEIQRIVVEAKDITPNEVPLQENDIIEVKEGWF